MNEISLKEEQVCSAILKRARHHQSSGDLTLEDVSSMSTPATANFPTEAVANDHNGKKSYRSTQATSDSEDVSIDHFHDPTPVIIPSPVLESPVNNRHTRPARDHKLLKIQTENRRLALDERRIKIAEDQSTKMMQLMQDSHRQLSSMVIAVVDALKAIHNK